MEPDRHSDPCETVIRYPWVWSAIIFCLFAILLGFYGIAELRAEARLRGVGIRAQLPMWVLAAAGPLILLVSAATARRRKLVITPDEVMYRPAIGRLRRTRFAEIGAIEQGNIYHFGGVIGPAAILTLKDYMQVAIPLNLPNHEEVLKRLIQAFQQRIAIHGHRESSQSDKPVSY